MAMPEKVYAFKGNLDNLDYMRIFMSGYLSILVLYYYQIIYDIKSKNLFSTFKVRAEIEVKNNIDKLDILYDSIINHIEQTKIYQDPKFSIRMLSEALKTNESYISKSISKNSNDNFNLLTNKYRINQVKEELNQNKHKVFTIEYIYKNAGFTQQSTFNRVFKDITAVTPSDYIESLEVLQNNFNQSQQ